MWKQTCQVLNIIAEESNGVEGASAENVVIEECVLDTFFGDGYDIIFTVENNLGAVADATVYWAIVDDQGVRVDEDWAGDSVNEIPIDGVSHGDGGEWFPIVEKLDTAPTNCQAVAVELDAR